MNCTTCTVLVEVNNTGVCLGCQRGFVKEPQEDSYEHHQRLENIRSKENLTKRLDEIEKELSHANEITSSKSLPTCQKTRDGQEMGEGNVQEKPTQESKEES